MAIHINDVLDYLDMHPIDCCEGGVESLMEMLHDTYVSYNSIDSGKIRRLFREIDSLTEVLSSDSSDHLHNLICDLCIEHEVLAFSHGIVVGMYLMTEVRTLP